MMKLLMPLIQEFNGISKEVGELEKRMDGLEKEEIEKKKNEEEKKNIKASTDSDSGSLSEEGWITANSSDWSEDGMGSIDFPDFSTIRKARIKNRQATLNVGGERLEKALGNLIISRRQTIATGFVSYHLIFILDLLVSDTQFCGTCWRQSPVLDSANCRLLLSTRPSWISATPTPSSTTSSFSIEIPKHSPQS